MADGSSTMPEGIETPAGDDMAEPAEEELAAAMMAMDTKTDGAEAKPGSDGEPDVPEATPLFDIAQFNGTWEIDTKRSDNLEEFLKFVGAPWAVRKLAKNMGGTVIIENSGNKWKSTQKTMQTQVTELTLGVGATIPTPMGQQQFIRARSTPTGIVLRSISKVGEVLSTYDFADATNEVIRVTMVGSKEGEVKCRLTRYMRKKTK